MGAHEDTVEISVVGVCSPTSLLHSMMLETFMNDWNSRWSMNINMTTHYTPFLCPNDLLAKLKAKAAKESRSLSNYLILLIEKHVANEPTPVKVVTKR